MKSSIKNPEIVQVQDTNFNQKELQQRGMTFGHEETVAVPLELNQFSSQNQHYQQLIQRNSTNIDIKGTEIKLKDSTYNYLGEKELKISNTKFMQNYQNYQKSQGLQQQQTFNCQKQSVQIKNNLNKNKTQQNDKQSFHAKSESQFSFNNQIPQQYGQSSEKKVNLESAQIKPDIMYFPQNLQFYQTFFQIIPEGVILLGPKSQQLHIINKRAESYLGLKGSLAIERLLLLKNNLQEINENESLGLNNSIPKALDMKNIIEKQDVPETNKKSALNNLMISQFYQQNGLACSKFQPIKRTNSLFSQFLLQEAQQSQQIIQNPQNQNIQVNQNEQNLQKSNYGSSIQLNPKAQLKNIHQETEESNVIFSSNEQDDNIQMKLSSLPTLNDLYNLIITDIENIISFGNIEDYQTFQHQFKMICSCKSLSSKPFNLEKNDMSENIEQISKKYFEVTCVPCIIEKKASVLFLLRDVTHFNQIKLLKLVNKNKSQMLSQVSHEFRTPLNCIISMIEMTCMQLSGQKNLLQYLKPALTSAKQLNYMVNDILDIAQVRVGKFSLNIEYFNLQELIQQLIDLLGIQATQKGINLKMKLQQVQNQMIASDPNRLRQIITNLVSNSLKFTKKGGSIVIQVKGIDESSIKISIKDTGIGISEEDQRNLFKKFGKIKGKEQSKLNPNGVGLGLVIANTLAGKLGDGQGLQIKSQIGKGTKFYFTLLNQQSLVKSIVARSTMLNLSTALINNSKKQQKTITVIKEVNRDKEEDDDQSPSRRRKQNKMIFVEQSQVQNVVNIMDSQGNIKSLTNIEDSKQKQEQMENIRILIVDDDCMNIHILRLKIQQEYPKIKIDSAQSAEEGFQQIQNLFQDNQDCYDIIFLDLSMPQISGYEAFEQIKKIYEQNNCPFLKVVACSGYQDSHEIQKCLEMGMVDYVFKPIEQQKLKQVLFEQLNS